MFIFALQLSADREIIFAKNVSCVTDTLRY